jgi:hypothetical protein
MSGTEYIFFDAELRDRFVQAVSAWNLVYQTRADTMEGFVVALPEEPDEATLDALEETYEALMDEQLLLAESRPDWVSHQVAGVQITRADGSACTVRLPATMARSLLASFSAEEVHELVTAIAHSLDNPVNGPLCKKA